ncbi:hypothetical protein U1Q18_005509 [Sarracenia purpurea var. burkii]
MGVAEFCLFLVCFGMLRGLGDGVDVGAVGCMLLGYGCGFCSWSWGYCVLWGLGVEVGAGGLTVYHGRWPRAVLLLTRVGYSWLVREWAVATGGVGLSGLSWSHASVEEQSTYETSAGVLSMAMLIHPAKLVAHLVTIKGAFLVFAVMVFAGLVVMLQPTI